MPNIVYYREGTTKAPGVRVSLADAVNNDDGGYRARFKERVRTDEHFFRYSLRQKADETPENYIKEYDQRAQDMVKATSLSPVAPSDTCVRLYEKGTVMPGQDSNSIEIQIKTADGRVRTFHRERDTCPWDEQHDGDMLPDDVTQVHGFGEGALLNVIRRRFLEQYKIYTYVGDILIVVNPYMFMSENVHIQEPAKAYQLGADPSIYATGHFAYWSLIKPGPMDLSKDGSKMNQSCIVSGESGSGKTISCGYLMRYLAKLSAWSKKSGSGRPKTSTKSMADLISGVSPFLEAFGNAKTNWNNNSSRFGKFMKIFFNAEGQIEGGVMEHYLLEKARLVEQGAGERSYHIFYFLLKGATPEERQRLRLTAPIESFAGIYKGQTKDVPCDPDELLGPDGKQLYADLDDKRMNAPLDPNKSPDDWGVRAALEAAFITPAEQQELWQVLAAILHLGNLKFKPGAAGMAMCANPDDAAFVAGLLGIKQENDVKQLPLSELLVIKRRELPGGEVLDSPVDPVGAGFNRDALIKSLYEKVFVWLVQQVNNVLKPDDGDYNRNFVGILDIFGFENFRVSGGANSLEQLCINFANEKLQKLFNSFVFDQEREIYSNEGVEDKVPMVNYQDNSACCDLVEKSSKDFVGIFPLLDDYKDKRDASDGSFCDDLIKRWGRDQHRPPNAKKKPPPLCKGSKARIAASKYFYANKGSGNRFFCIRHFAGDIRYDVEGFLEKNKDQIPKQLEDAVLASDSRFIQEGLLAAAEDDKRSSKRKSRKATKPTIVARFKSQLRSLGNLLDSTTPHYVRCVKPNDVKMKVIDGTIAFDDYKTYRQLLYSGVMEVCKIKKQGFPFRESYEAFWARSVARDFHTVLHLPANMEPREGTEIICKNALPATIVDEAGNTMPFWTMGNTMVFGKDVMAEKLLFWHMSLVSNTIRTWARFATPLERLSIFKEAARQLTSRWRSRYLEKKVAAIMPSVLQMQQLAKCAIAKKELLRRRALYDLAARIQTQFRFRYAKTEWSRVALRLSKLAEQKRAAETLQHAARASQHRKNMIFLWRGLVRARADQCVNYLVNNICTQVRQAYSISTLCLIAQRKLHRIRTVIRVQAHMRGQNVRAEFAAVRAAHRAVLAGSMEVQCLWRATVERRTFKEYLRHIVWGQALARMFLACTRYRDTRARIIVIQAFARMVVCRTAYNVRLGAIVQAQRFSRYTAIMRMVRVASDAARVIQKAWLERLTQRKLTAWVAEAQRAATMADNESLRELLRCDPPYERLLPLRRERIPTYGGGGAPLEVVNGLVNIRDPAYFTTLLHAAAKSGCRETVQILLDEGATVDVWDAIHETPLHCSCNLGDAALPTSQLLLEASEGQAAAAAAAVNADRPASPWILSPEAGTLQGGTVLDAALQSAEQRHETVYWLIEAGAQASVDMEGLVREEIEERRERLRQIAELNRRKRLVEENEHKQDELYGLFFDEEYEAVPVDRSGAPFILADVPADDEEPDRAELTSYEASDNQSNVERRIGDDEGKEDMARTPDTSSRRYSSPPGAGAGAYSGSPSPQHGETRLSPRSRAAAAVTPAVAAVLARERGVEFELSPKPKSAAVDPITIELQNRRLETNVRQAKEYEYSVRLWAAVKLQDNYRQHLAKRRWKPPKGAEAIALKQEYQDRIKAASFRSMLEQQRATQRRRRSTQIARRAGRRVDETAWPTDRLDPSEEALRVRRMKNRLQYKNSQLKKQQLQSEVAAMVSRNEASSGAFTSDLPKQYEHEYRMRRSSGPQRQQRLTPQQERQAKFEELKGLIQRANRETAVSIERDLAAASALEKSAARQRQLPAMQARRLTDADLEWMRAYSDNGRPYFYNIRTGESRWKRPDSEALRNAQGRAVTDLRAALDSASARAVGAGSSVEAGGGGSSNGETHPESGEEEKRQDGQSGHGRQSAWSSSGSGEARSPAPQHLEPHQALYAQLLTSLLWYRGSTGNGLDGGSGGGAGWFYLDKVGQVHGPFEPSMMRAWLRGGFFNEKLPVRYGLPATSEADQARLLHQFLPIECYFPKGIEAFPPVTREAMVKALQGVRQRLLGGLERPLGVEHRR